MKQQRNKINKEIRKKSCGGDKWHEERGRKFPPLTNSVNDDPKRGQRKAKEKNEEKMRRK